MGVLLSRRWKPRLYTDLSRFVKIQFKKNSRNSTRIPDARTMPDLSALSIGSAKRMTAAILFFDFENFTGITSRIPPEEALTILNVSTTAVMRIVREWNGTVEKHTGDGVMAILGTETPDPEIIARESIEVAQTIKYIMLTDVLPNLTAHGYPALSFRIGIEMGEVLISRIGLHNMNFLTAVGSPANRASKLEGLAGANGIAIGETLAQSLHVHLHKYLEQGDNPSWNWKYSDGQTGYNYYHYNFEWPEPKQWLKERVQLCRIYR